MIRRVLTPAAVALAIVVGVLAGGSAAVGEELPITLPLPEETTAPVEPAPEPETTTPPVTTTPEVPTVVTPPAATTPTTPRTTTTTPRTTTPSAAPTATPSATPTATPTPTPTPTPTATPTPRPSLTSVPVDTRVPASAVQEESPLAIGALIVSAVGILGLAGYFVVHNRKTLRMRLRRLMRHRNHPGG